MPVLNMPCRECGGHEDVRLVRHLLRGDGGYGVREYSKGRAMCRPCRRKFRARWKWCRPTEARDVERSLER